MSTCKECIHEIVCDALIKTGLPWADGEYPAEAFCMAFKGKNDLVEVVRCKDCKMSDYCYPIKEKGKEAEEGWYCKRNRKYVKPNDFCSYGKRKDS